MKTDQWKYQSSIGTIYLLAHEKALVGIYWKAQRLPMIAESELNTSSGKILKRTAKQLEEFFQGTRVDFDLPLEIQGTEFQKSVWQQLKLIPYGKTCAYSDIAQQIKNAKAVRAVGTANGRNPYSIIVPCHRVIALDGSLGGYAGGLEIKKKLLEIEQKKSSNNLP